MTTQAIEREMLELENTYWQGLVDQDVAKAKAATNDPCIVAGASGAATINGEMFAQMMTGADWKLLRFKLDDVQVEILTDDVRVVAYKVHEELTVQGEPVSMDAADVSVWVRKGGTWKCAVHTESLLGDSYGRDKSK